MDIGAQLAHVWFAILAVLLFLYLITDGFDFGVGMMLLLQPDEASRDIMTHSIEPVWHANQTWLVISGGVLFGAFPAVYGSVLAALYLPLALLLFALMCRGVALEYRGQATQKGIPSVLVALGSLASAFSLGLLLGGALQGLPLENGEFTGSALAWMRPFPLVLGLAVCAMDLVLGGCWLAIKTEGRLQQRAIGWTKAAVLLTGVLIVVAISLALFDDNGATLQRGLLGALPLACLCGGIVALGMVLPAVGGNAPGKAFVLASLAVLLFMLTFAGAVYPFLVPPQLGLVASAAPPEMLQIMLYVIGGLLPVLIFYNGYQYRVFRGKTRLENEI